MRRKAALILCSLLAAQTSAASALDLVCKSKDDPDDAVAISADLERRSFSLDGKVGGTKWTDITEKELKFQVDWGYGVEEVWNINRMSGEATWMAVVDGKTASKVISYQCTPASPAKRVDPGRN